MRIESVEDYLTKMEDIGAFTYVVDKDGDIYQQTDCDGLFWIMGDCTPMSVEEMRFPLEVLEY